MKKEKVVEVLEATGYMIGLPLILMYPLAIIVWDKVDDIILEIRSRLSPSERRKRQFWKLYREKVPEEIKREIFEIFRAYVEGSIDEVTADILYQNWWRKVKEIIDSS